MDGSWIKTLYEPKLENPIFIQGLSLSDKASPHVTSLLLKHSNPSKFAELYSPYFPDYVIAGENGLCTLPRCEFYANSQLEPNIVLLTGSAQLLPEGASANYEVFTTIFDYAIGLGCKKFLSYGCFKTERVENDVYVAATSGKLASDTVNKLGGKVFSQGRIMGSIGLILGLAHSRGLRGICVLKPLAYEASSEVTALSIFNHVLRIIELEKRN